MSDDGVRDYADAFHGDRYRTFLKVANQHRPLRTNREAITWASGQDEQKGRATYR